MSNFFSLIIRTVKSFSKKEELASFILVLILLISGYLIFKPFDYSVSLSKIDKKTKTIEVYSEGIVGQIKRLNPLYVDLNPIDRDISYLIFSGLSKYEPQQKTFTEDLAFHTLSQDKKTYNFAIKPNAYWHDGVKVTADDVYFTFHDLIQNKAFASKNPILASNFAGIEIKKTGEFTITFTLKNPNSFFFSTLTTGILPYHLLKGVSLADLDKHEFNKNPIGTGAYKISETIKKINENSSIVNLTLFDKYYGVKPPIKNIRLTTFIDQETAIKSKDALHSISKIITPALLQPIREDSRFKIYKYTLPQYTALFFNLDSKILKNKNVRLALSKSINKQESIFNTQSRTSIDTPIFEMDQNDWLHQFSLEESKGALYDANWKFSEENSTIREKNDEKLVLTLLYQIPENSSNLSDVNTLIQYIQQQFAKIGCQVAIKGYKIAELEQKIIDRDYDILLYGQSLGYNLDTFAYWHSSQAGDGSNLSNYRNPTVDSLIEKIRNTFAPAEKIKRLNLLAQIISEDIPAVFLYTPTYYFLADKMIANIDLSNLAFGADRYASVSNWEFTSN